MTVALSPQLFDTHVLLGGDSVVAMVGVVFVGTQPLGRLSAASVVLSVPLPGVPSDHVALQCTLMVELGVSAASCAAVRVWVNVWCAALGGVEFVVGDAAMDRAVVLRMPWVVEKVPVSVWFQSL